MTGSPDGTYVVRAVVRAVQLLDLLRAADKGLKLQELSVQSGLAKASVFRMLRTLEQLHLVERVPDTESYRLGLRCLELGEAFLEQVDVRREALPAMERLREQFSETVHLAVLDDDVRIVYLEQLPGGQAVSVAARVGRTSPSYCTGIGKALLSVLDDPVGRLEQKGPLHRWTENTITDPEQLRIELETTRDRGYALDREEHEPGVKCVGAPVEGPHGWAGAISLTGPAHRMPDAFMVKEVAPAVIAAARDISARLGAKTRPPKSFAGTATGRQADVPPRAGQEGR